MMNGENTYKTSVNIAAENFEGFHDRKHLSIMNRIINLSFVELPAMKCDRSHAITLILGQYRSDCKTGGIGRHILLQYVLG